MRLTEKDLAEKQAWQAADINLPQFDWQAVRRVTSQRPTWLHFGAGNIFRLFIAGLQQQLLNQGQAETGIIVAETFDRQIIDRIFKAHDHLSLSVQMHHDGQLTKEVVASMTESLALDQLVLNSLIEKTTADTMVAATADTTVDTTMERCLAILAAPSLQLISLTVTEKGYALQNDQGDVWPVVKQDMAAGPQSVRHIMAILTAGLYHRFLNGQQPIALVSFDNCSHNGDRIKQAVISLASEWLAVGRVEPAFMDYLTDRQKVGFPLTMIDKITPRPSEQVKHALEESGLTGMDIVVTDKKSYTAPFVNAETSQYLVIEDWFPNGRPALEKAGVLFGDRQTVNQVETMKVTTCLNPLHTALAVAGCLLGYQTIAEEMADPLLAAWVHRIGYDEGLKVVVDPKIIDPTAFIDEVVKQRLPNPYIPDTPQRIATDTSQKVAIRFGQTIKAYQQRSDLAVGDLVGIGLALAAWLRYLLAVDDQGQPMALSADPWRERLTAQLQPIRLVDSNNPMTENEVAAVLQPILSNQAIFGLDLYQTAMAEMVSRYFSEMIDGPGAVKQTLQRHLGD